MFPYASSRTLFSHWDSKFLNPPVEFSAHSLCIPVPATWKGLNPCTHRTEEAGISLEAVSPPYKTLSSEGRDHHWDRTPAKAWTMHTIQRAEQKEWRQWQDVLDPQTDELSWQRNRDWPSRSGGRGRGHGGGRLLQDRPHHDREEGFLLFSRILEQQLHKCLCPELGPRHNQAELTHMLERNAKTH